MLEGDSGNDVFIVDNVDDEPVESTSGTDTVRSTIAWTLGDKLLKRLSCSG